MLFILQRFFHRLIIYIVMSGIDRFVYHIPNVMYIPVAILGIALILIGFFKEPSWNCQY